MTRHIRSAALAAGLALSAVGAEAQTVGIATSNPGSLYHSIGTAIANAANQAGLNTTIQPATSPNQFIPMMNGGGIEFGIANLQEVNYALEGKAWFEGQPNPNLRMVAMLMPLREAIFVRADSDIKTVADLKGKPMVDGYTAQNTILPQLDAIYSTAGLSRADMVAVNVPSVVAGADAFIAGDAVGFIFAHGAAKVREADAAVGGLRALPVGEVSEAALAAAREHWPTAYFTEMKKDSSPGVLEDGTYFAFAQVIFANKDVPDDVVYAMVKAMHEGKDTMKGTSPPFAAFNPKHMHGDALNVEFHPGALKFNTELGR
jgi:TRAP transporter TAXI family solute receptor